MGQSACRSSYFHQVCQAIDLQLLGNTAKQERHTFVMAMRDMGLERYTHPVL
jgi:hypothetical protein